MPSFVNEETMLLFTFIRLMSTLTFVSVTKTEVSATIILVFVTENPVKSTENNASIKNGRYETVSIPFQYRFHTVWEKEKVKE